MTPVKFIAALQACGLSTNPKLAVAVSGGGDSMALAMLLHGAGCDIVCFTVDHGLRDGSRAEAEAVAAFFAARNIKHRILTWQGEKPATRIQERARDSRYDLLLAACRAEGRDILALGHNQEDQLETFWMRLAHGSGLDGLAGMAPSRDVDGIRLIRPLLNFTRAELRDYCKAAGIPYADDPSNSNEKFLRVKLRSFEDLLSAEGLSPERLNLTLQKLEDAKQALAWAAEKAAGACVIFSDGGAALDKKAWLAYPRDIRHRVVAGLLQKINPQKYPPEFASLDRLCADLAGDGFSGCTLGGCLFAPKKGGVFVSREVSIHNKIAIAK